MYRSVLVWLSTFLYTLPYMYASALYVCSAEVYFYSNVTYGIHRELTYLTFVKITHPERVDRVRGKVELYMYTTLHTKLFVVCVLIALSVIKRKGVRDLPLIFFNMFTYTPCYHKATNIVIPLCTD
jgi:hypothetical protein